MWSLGVIMYILCCGKYPNFYYPPGHDFTSKAKSGQYSLMDKCWKRISSEAKELLNQLLEPNPDQRICIEDAINSKWIILNKN